MTNQHINPVSRRKFLSVSIAGVAGTVALAGCATLGLPRVSKASAGYQLTKTKATVKCLLLTDN